MKLLIFLQGSVASIKPVIFQNIFEQVIKPACESMAQNLKLEYSLDSTSIYREYQKQKTYFRLLSNKPEYSENGYDLLDRHKICAALCVAIIRANVFNYSDTNDDTVHDLNAFRKINEQFAIGVSLSLLRCLIKHDCEELAILFDNCSFIFPSPQNDKEEYEDTLVRTLYFASLTGQPNLHLIAHIFFLIEKYHILAKKSQS